MLWTISVFTDLKSSKDFQQSWLLNSIILQSKNSWQVNPQRVKHLQIKLFC